MNASNNSTLIEVTAWLSQNAFNLLIQSTALILLGLVAARILSRYGSAVQSAICRATLVAVLACPIFAIAIDQLGFDGWTIQLPKTTRTVLVPEPEQTIFEYRPTKQLVPNSPVQIDSTQASAEADAPLFENPSLDGNVAASTNDEFVEDSNDLAVGAFPPTPTAITSSGKLIPRTIPNLVFGSVSIHWPESSGCLVQRYS